MAHYDCRNCDERGGIAYGICTACTPKEVFEAERAFNNAYRDAERQFLASVEAAKLEFMNGYIAPFKAAYDAAYAAGRPKGG